MPTVFCVLTIHSLHHTLPSPSVFAPLSNRFPQPGLPRSLFSFPFPPHTRQLECHLLPFGPGTTPLSIGDTDRWHPGQMDVLPNLVTGLLVGEAVKGSPISGRGENSWITFTLELRLKMTFSGTEHYSNISLTLTICGMRDDIRQYGNSLRSTEQKGLGYS